MANPTIRAVEVLVPTGIHDLENSHVSAVKVDIEWVVGSEMPDPLPTCKAIIARLTIPEARAWIDSLVCEIESIESRYA